MDNNETPNKKLPKNIDKSVEDGKRFIDKLKRENNISKEESSNWFKNAAKSLGYAGIDVLKETLPSITSTIDVNKDFTVDVIGRIGAAIKNRNLSELTGEMSEKNKRFIENLNKIKTNAISDALTGKFVNKDRAESSMMDDDDFDIDGFDDDSFSIDVDDNFDDNIDDNDDITVVSPDITINSNIGKNNPMVKAVSAQTDLMMQNEKASAARALGISESHMTLTKEVTSVLYSGIESINSNLKTLVEFNNDKFSGYVGASLKYYEDSTKFMGEMVTSLKIMSGLAEKKELKNYKSNPWDEILESDNALNISSYLQMVKKQAVRQIDDNFILGSLKNLFYDSDIGLQSLIDNPLEFIPKMIINKILPEVVTTTLSEFDKSFKNFVPALLHKVGSWAVESDTGPIKRLIGEIFGVQNKVVKTIDTSLYDRGPVPFDGLTKKSIVQIIPTYLSKILAALTGKDELIFNDKTGKFISKSELDTEYENSLKRAALSKFDSASEMKNRVGAFGLNSEESEELKTDIDNMLYKLAQRKERLKLYYKEDETNDLNELLASVGVNNTKKQQIIRSIILSLPRNMQYALAGTEHISATSEIKNVVERMEREGDIIGTSKFSGAYSPENDAAANNKLLENAGFTVEDKKGKKKKHASIFTPNDEFGHNSLYYIRRIYKILLEGIRVYTKYDDKGLIAKRINDSVLDDKRHKIDKNRERIKPVKRTSDSDKAKRRERGQQSFDTIDNVPESERTQIEHINQYVNFRENADKDNNKLKNTGLYKLYKFLLGNKTERAEAIHDTLSSVTGAFKGFFDKIDAGMYKIIFGENAVTDVEVSRRGVFGSFITKFKTWLFGEKDDDGKKSVLGVFDKFHNFVKDNFYNPIKESLLGDDGIITKLKQSELFKNLGIIGREAFKHLFGSIDENGKYKGGMFSDFASKVSTAFRGTKVSSVELRDDGFYYDITTGDRITDSSTISGLSNINLDTTSDDYDGDIRVGGVFGEVKNIFSSVKSGIKTWLFGNDSDSTKENVKGALTDILSNMKMGFQDFADTIFGKKYNVETGELESVDDEIIEKIKSKAPKAVAAGIVGGIASLFAAAGGFGVLGSLFLGPLSGVAIGIGASLASQSDKFKDWLFGVKDELGVRVGGLISKSTQMFFSKHKTGIVAGATLGTIRGILNGSFGGIFGALPSFFLGGPITGALFGLATAILVRSEMFQKAFFGEKDLDGKRSGGIVGSITNKFKEKNKGKTAGYALAGGILGGTTGGLLSSFGILGSFAFGPLIGSIVGAGAGITLAANKWKDKIFGTFDKDTGKRTEQGIMDKMMTAVTVEVLQPAKVRLSELNNNLINWFNEKIAEPFLTFIDPIKEEISRFNKRLQDTIVNIVNMTGIPDLFSNIGDNIIIGLDKIFGAVSSFTKKAFGFIAGATRKIIELPFNLLGKIGQSLIEKHLKSGVKKLKDTAIDNIKDSWIGRTIRGTFVEIRNSVFGVIKSSFNFFKFVATETFKVVGETIIGLVKSPFKLLGLIGKGIKGLSNFFSNRKREKIVSGDRDYGEFLRTVAGKGGFLENFSSLFDGSTKRAAAVGIFKDRESAEIYVKNNYKKDTGRELEGEQLKNQTDLFLENIATTSNMLSSISDRIKKQSEKNGQPITDDEANKKAMDQIKKDPQALYRAAVRERIKKKNRIYNKDMDDDQLDSAVDSYIAKNPSGANYLDKLEDRRRKRKKKNEEKRAARESAIDEMKKRLKLNKSIARSRGYNLLTEEERNALSFKDYNKQVDKINEDLYGKDYKKLNKIEKDNFENTKATAQASVSMEQNIKNMNDLLESVVNGTKQLHTTDKELTQAQKDEIDRKMHEVKDDTKIEGPLDDRNILRRADGTIDDRTAWQRAVDNAKERQRTKRKKRKDDDVAEWGLFHQFMSFIDPDIFGNRWIRSVMFPKIFKNKQNPIENNEQVNSESPIEETTPIIQEYNNVVENTLLDNTVDDKKEKRRIRRRKRKNKQQRKRNKGYLNSDGSITVNSELKDEMLENSTQGITQQESEEDKKNTTYRMSNEELAALTGTGNELIYQSFLNDTPNMNLNSENKTNILQYHTQGKTFAESKQEISELEQKEMEEEGRRKSDAIINLLSEGNRERKDHNMEWSSIFSKKGLITLGILAVAKLLDGLFKGGFNDLLNNLADLIKEKFVEGLKDLAKAIHDLIFGDENDNGTDRTDASGDTNINTNAAGAAGKAALKTIPAAMKGTAALIDNMSDGLNILKAKFPFFKKYTSQQVAEAYNTTQEYIESMIGKSKNITIDDLVKFSGDDKSAVKKFMNTRYTNLVTTKSYTSKQVAEAFNTTEDYIKSKFGKTNNITIDDIVRFSGDDKPSVEKFMNTRVKNTATSKADDAAKALLGQKTTYNVDELSKVFDDAPDSIANTFGKRNNISTDEIAKYFGIENTDEVTDIIKTKLGNKAITTTVTSEADDIVETAFKKSSLIDKLKNLMKIAMDGLLDHLSKKFPKVFSASNTMYKGIKAVFDKILSTKAGILIRKFGKKISEKLAKYASQASKTISVITYTYAGVTGLTAKETANLFRVSEDQVTLTMRFAAAGYKVLLNYAWFPIFDLVSEIGVALGCIDIKRELLSLLYELRMQDLMYMGFVDKNRINDLHNDQKDFQTEFLEYTKAQQLAMGNVKLDANGQIEYDSDGNPVLIDESMKETFASFNDRQNSTIFNTILNNMAKGSPDDTKIEGLNTRIDNLEKSADAGLIDRENKYYKQTKQSLEVAIKENDLGEGKTYTSEQIAHVYRTTPEDIQKKIGKNKNITIDDIVNSMYKKGTTSKKYVYTLVEELIKEKDATDREEPIFLIGDVKKKFDLSDMKPEYISGMWANRALTIDDIVNFTGYSKEEVKKRMAGVKPRNNVKPLGIGGELPDLNNLKEIKESDKKSSQVPQFKGYNINQNYDENYAKTELRNEFLNKKISNTLGIGGDEELALLKQYKKTSDYNIVRGFNGGRVHRGIDLAKENNAPIHSFTDGVVKYVESGHKANSGFLGSKAGGGYGNYVVVTDALGNDNYYAHLNGVNVKVGDNVKRGTKLGIQGHTGNSTGSHLHYEVRLKGGADRADPTKYLEKYNSSSSVGYLDESSTTTQSSNSTNDTNTNSQPSNPFISSLTNLVNNITEPINTITTSIQNSVNNALGFIADTSSLSNNNNNTYSSSSSTNTGSLPNGSNLIGDYVKQFESGNAGPEMISSGAGDHGGVSFGTYQFPSYNKTPSGGLLQRFWDTYYKSEYPNVTPGNNQAFKNAWKDAVSKNKDLFHKREWMISKEGDYEPARRELIKRFGYDPNKDSRAAQEAVWSTALQAPAIVPGNYKKAFGSTDSTSMDNSEWVKKFYQAKRDMVPQNFRSSSASVQKGVYNRYIREEPIVAALASQAPLQYEDGIGGPIDDNYTPSVKNKSTITNSNTFRTVSENLERMAKEKINKIENNKSTGSITNDAISYLKSIINNLEKIVSNTNNTNSKLDEIKVVEDKVAKNTENTSSENVSKDNSNDTTNSPMFNKIKPSSYSKNSRDMSGYNIARMIASGI